MTTQEVLQQCIVEGLIVRLPDVQLDRKEYLEVAKKLELIGGKWKGGKTKGFVFEQNPTELLNDLANGDQRNLKKEFQFFATPEHIADILVNKLSLIKSGYKILEPSAGDGALIKSFRKYFGDLSVVIDCFELMELNRKKLALIEGLNILGDDFLKIDLISSESYRDHYDIILANPPFTKNQDIDHIRKMFEVCKPGGAIVTLSSPSWTFGSQKKQVEFREWLDELCAEKIEIDSGEFKESGTAIRTILLVIKKPVVEENNIDSKQTLPSASKAVDTDNKEVEERICYSDDDLREFKTLIENKLESAQKELDYLNSFTVEKSETRVTSNQSPDADFEKEQIKQMAKRQEAYINNLNDALKRIADKNYGVCRTTGKLIDKARLIAVPHATLSLEAKLGLDKKTQEQAATHLPAKPKNKSIKNNVRTCRICGCTEEDCSQCIEKTGKPCHWIDTDLCSACEEEAMKESEENPQSEIHPFITELINQSSNNNDMNFFSQLAGLGHVDLTMRIMQDKNGKLTIGIEPGLKSHLKPLNFTGTPAEFDEDFFKTIMPSVQEIKGIASNINEVKKDLQETKSTASSTPAKQEGKKSDKKAANKKAPQQKVEVKKEEIKTEEPHLFE